jgi:hypothetical protein
MFEAVIVGEAVAGESKKVRDELEKLIHTINTSTFDVADLLHTVKSKGYYKAYGFNTFLEYLAELDIKTRKAQYLVRIVDIMTEVCVPREIYQPVGIAKLREITSLDTHDSNGDEVFWDNPETGESLKMRDIIVGLVEKAPTMTLSELKEYVKLLKGLVGENDLTWLNISVNTQALQQTILPAFHLAKQNLGSSYKDEEGMSHDYSDGKALEMICAEYLNDPSNSFLGANE